MKDISIIIPAFNNVNFLKEAIESVYKSKTKYSFDIIVVNDGSKELGVENLCLEFKEKNQNFFYYKQENKGQGAARNLAISKSNSKYILTLDSDNLIDVNFIEIGLDYFHKNNEIDILYTNFIEFYELEEIRLNDVSKPDSFNFQKLMLDNYIDNCTIYKKEVWEDNGGYDEISILRGIEDWDFWLKSAWNKKKFFKLEIVGYYYRLRKDSSSKIFNQNKKNINKVFEYFEKKYSNFYSREEIEKYYLKIYKKNKLIYTLRPFIAIYFPKIVNNLITKGYLRKNII